VVEQLRAYTIRDEHWDEWVEFFTTHLVPLHEQFGIPVVSTYREVSAPEAKFDAIAPVVAEGTSRFVWIRRFSSVEAAAAEEQRYAQSPERQAVSNEVPMRAIVGQVFSFLEPV
jgi:hypothetical protein